jgi:hypothetical protein
MTLDSVGSICGKHSVNRFLEILVKVLRLLSIYFLDAKTNHVGLT